MSDTTNITTAYSVRHVRHLGRHSHHFQGRSGFNALAPRSTVFYRVEANVELANGATNHYTVAEFYPSQLEGEFATDAQSAANEYAATLNRKEAPR